MKKTPLLVLALIAAALGYWGTRTVLPPPSDRPGEEARLAWLAREFALTPAEISAIRRLQADYAPVCADHCSAIARAQTALGNATTPAARQIAQATLDRLEATCSAATRDHLRAVAAHMRPAEATRFLALMEPRVAHGPGRTGAPALDGPP